MTSGRGLSFASGARPHQIGSSSPGPANDYVYDGNGSLRWRPDTDGGG
jgi:hypothetical protein